MVGSKRILVLLLGLSLLLAMALGHASAQRKFPVKPVTLVAPYAAGGGSDLLARVFAKHAEKYLGQPIAVINVTGAGGVTGHRYVKDSRPDGYTLLCVQEAIFSTYYMGQANFTWKDFEPIAMIAKEASEVFVVRADSPWKTLGELFEDARKRPGEITWGSSLGGVSHVHLVVLFDATGTDFRLVGYGGAGEYLLALLGGHLDVVKAPYGNTIDHVKKGNLRALAAATKIPEAPDIPSLSELGIDLPMELSYNRGLYAPKGTPKEVIEVLEEVARKTCADAAFQADLEKIAMTPFYLNRADYIEWHEKTDEVYKKYVSKMKS